MFILTLLPQVLASCLACHLQFNLNTYDKNALNFVWKNREGEFNSIKFDFRKIKEGVVEWLGSRGVCVCGISRSAPLRPDLNWKLSLPGVSAPQTRQGHSDKCLLSPGLKSISLHRSITDTTADTLIPLHHHLFPHVPPSVLHTHVSPALKPQDRAELLLILPEFGKQGSTQLYHWSQRKERSSDTHTHTQMHFSTHHSPSFNRNHTHHICLWKD